MKENTNVLLNSKIYLTLGIPYIVIYEESTETKRKLKHDYLDNAIEYFKKAVDADQYDHLPYYHSALLIAHQRDIENAIKNV